MTKPDSISQAIWDTLTPEAQACFAAVIGRLERRIADLEARLNQNSTNSSRPPSTDPPGLQRLAVGAGLKARDGHPAELVFRHAGHTSAIESIAWNPAHHGGWTLASTAGSVMHIWRMQDWLWRPRAEAVRDAVDWQRKRKASAVPVPERPYHHSSPSKRAAGLPTPAVNASPI